MQLTTSQRRVLDLYRRYLAEPPGTNMVRDLFIRRHLPIILAVVLVVYLAWRFTDPMITSLASFLAGIALGTIGRDMARTRQMVEIWPVMERILDRERIEAMSEGRDGEF